MAKQGYYHWSDKKPVTTNENYGLFLQDIKEVKVPKIVTKKKKLDLINAYTRPFSNTAFYPPKYAGFHTNKLERSYTCMVNNKPNRYDINKGYSYGQASWSAKSKNVHTEKPLRSTFFTGGSQQSFEGASFKKRDIYLWHSLTGCLVNVKGNRE